MQLGNAKNIRRLRAAAMALRETDTVKVDLSAFLYFCAINLARASNYTLPSIKIMEIPTQFHTAVAFTN